MGNFAEKGHGNLAWPSDLLFPVKCKWRWHLSLLSRSLNIICPVLPCCYNDHKGVCWRILLCWANMMNREACCQPTMGNVFFGVRVYSLTTYQQAVLVTFTSLWPNSWENQLSGRKIYLVLNLISPLFLGLWQSKSHRGKWEWRGGIEEGKLHIPWQQGDVERGARNKTQP